jgi:hypothetical protein
VARAEKAVDQLAQQRVLRAAMALRSRSNMEPCVKDTAMAAAAMAMTAVLASSEALNVMAPS